MESSDAYLIKQCLSGDNAGFDLLVKRYQRQVHNFCYGMLGNMEDASDAAQECFVKAYYALDRFRMDSRFLTWVLRIASNACIDLLRRRACRQTLSLDEGDSEAAALPSAEPSPDAVLLAGESGRLVHDAVSRLPEKYRSALVMFYFGEMSVVQISEALGRPEGTVKSDLHIAREMLRRKLEGVVVQA